MDFDFADLLMDVSRATRPTCTSPPGAAPMRPRARPARRRWTTIPRLTPTDTREIVYSILTNDQRQRLETDWQIDFAYSIPGHARFRVNAYFQRGAIGAAFRLIPAKIVSIDDLGLPAVAARVHARSRAASCSSPARPARASPPRWRR